MQFLIFCNYFPMFHFPACTVLYSVPFLYRCGHALFGSWAIVVKVIQTLYYLPFLYI
jgi:hypothetical protein